MASKYLCGGLYGKIEKKLNFMSGFFELQKKYFDKYLDLNFVNHFEQFDYKMAKTIFKDLHRKNLNL